MFWTCLLLTVDIVDLPLFLHFTLGLLTCYWSHCLLKMVLKTLNRTFRFFVFQMGQLTNKLQWFPSSTPSSTFSLSYVSWHLHIRVRGYHLCGWRMSHLLYESWLYGISFSYQQLPNILKCQLLLTVNFSDFRLLHVCHIIRPTTNWMCPSHKIWMNGLYLCNQAAILSSWYFPLLSVLAR